MQGSLLGTHHTQDRLQQQLAVRTAAAGDAQPDGLRALNGVSAQQGVVDELVRTLGC